LNEEENEVQSPREKEPLSEIEKAKELLNSMEKKDDGVRMTSLSPKPRNNISSPKQKNNDNVAETPNSPRLCVTAHSPRLRSLSPKSNVPSTLGLHKEDNKININNSIEFPNDINHLKSQMQCYSERNDRHKTPASQFVCKTPTAKSNNPLQKYLDRPILTPLSKAEFKKHSLVSNKDNDNNPSGKFLLKTEANFNRR